MSDQPEPEEIDPQESVKQEEEEAISAVRNNVSEVSESQKYLDQLLRLQAEFANYRKRSEKEKIDAIRFGKVLIMERMISLLDIMEEALKHTQNATDLPNLVKGFEMVVSEFQRFLKSEGAEALKTLGERFDPHIHEAIEQIPTENEEENNIIVGEIQKGYQMNNQILRPAKVKVAKIKNK